MGKSQNHLFGLADHDLAQILRGAETEFEVLRGKKVFISGGTGFFGKWLLAALCHADAELGLGLRLTVLSRDPAPFLRRHPQIGEVRSLRFVKGHVADFSSEEDHHDYILHAATDTSSVATEAQEQERTRTIIGGTRRMLDLAQKWGAQRLLNMSSGSVYGTFSGQQSGAKEDEYAAAQALMPYAVAKREAEQLCAESGVDFVTARGFAFLGPHLPLDVHYAAGNFLRDAMRGGPILVRGDGTALRSYLYPVDLVAWLLRMLLRGERGRAYNLGSDEVVSTSQLARHMAEAAGRLGIRPVPEVVVQSVQPQGTQNIYLPNLQRARTELNLDVTVPLRDAIKRTLEFLVPPV